MSYHLKLKVFEGPLDLLYHLIQVNKIDIYDIPIHEITDQYMDYLQTIQSLDLEIASEFLVMAATLLEIKSRMLLPKEEKNSDDTTEESDPRDELVNKLLEYQIYKAAADELKRSEEQVTSTYFKSQEDLSKYLMDRGDDGLLDDTIDINCLKEAFEKVLLNSFRRKSATQTSKPIHLANETYKVSQQMLKIKKALRSSNAALSFTNFFINLSCKQEVVVTFLALLEMIQKGLVTVNSITNSINDRVDSEIKEVS
ncbi:segregation and condensation protein A [Tindallia californiensis]|uniref:Segregation and condensation protein A n=1 Tax=Tindallia californiensis TaxID=159292 RepID=A0A1H3NLC1_9FIRM|nr:segregation/condensation protein A [Tindallia californiensis]SDY89553.1 condensin subunit ScpA [Tindallia californiensis]